VPDILEGFAPKKQRYGGGKTIGGFSKWQ